MGRRLLEAAGFDPDEEFEITPDIECGATILNFFIEYGCLPRHQNEFDRIAEIANFNLRQRGLDENANIDTVMQALAVIQESGLSEK